jgi:hypothetical protein
MSAGVDRHAETLNQLALHPRRGYGDAGTDERQIGRQPLRVPGIPFQPQEEARGAPS